MPLRRFGVWCEVLEVSPVDAVKMVDDSLQGMQGLTQGGPAHIAHGRSGRIFSGAAFHWYQTPLYKQSSTVLRTLTTPMPKTPPQPPKRRTGKFQNIFSNVFGNEPVRSGGLSRFIRSISLGARIVLGLRTNKIRRPLRGHQAV